MKTVIEFLETIEGGVFEENTRCTPKEEDGHYQTFGGWVYLNESTRGKIRVDFNNEKALLQHYFIGGIDKKRLRRTTDFKEYNPSESTVEKFRNIPTYGYLDLYSHLPRDPDENGYCQRSTEEEIIKYIKDHIEYIDYNISEERNKTIEKIINN
tara:strand:+ start:274 stop:735 length:462 start_codon:yes stop_codon:yes gene_type:complete